MPIGVCPHCRNQFVYNILDIDFIHTCNSREEVFDNEDVLLEGDYINEATGELILVDNPNLQGVANKAPLRARIMGVKIEDYNNRGNPTSRTRSRQHYEYIKLR